MDTKRNVWVKVALINLCIVASLGLIMRYKICFELPFVNQKYFQEAHSHFAFTGWITHTLYCLLVNLFRDNLNLVHVKRYGILILINLFSAYGMLVAFTLHGYGPVSITFSSLSLLNGYVFYYFAFRDASRLPAGYPAKNWIKGAVLFGFLSTAGTVVLSHMMATREYDQEIYLGSVFLYLHFQYNGWFLFACAALFMDRLKSIIGNDHRAVWAFRLFFLAAIPAYFLSTLWADLPEWLYALVVLAALFQVIGWWLIIRLLQTYKVEIRTIFLNTTRLLLLTVALAITLKLLLQLLSTIPAVSELAFGFRPIVIAYLHLVLLLIVSIFLLTYLYSSGWLKQNKATQIFLALFVAGVIFNEFVLATQGILGFSYTLLPFAREMLLSTAALMWSSVCLILASQFRTPPQ